MVYEPKYVTVEDVRRETQIVDFTNDTRPSEQEVVDWIADTEAEVDAQRLGWGEDRSEGEGYLATNVYLDVPAMIPRMTPLRRFELLAMYSTDPYLMAKGSILQIPDEYRPVIDFTSLEFNVKDLDQLPSWTALTQGYYDGWSETAGSDYKILRKKGKAGQQHGVAIWFYGSERPTTGVARMKATFSHGWNLPLRVIKRWCLCQLAPRVLNAAVESGEPTRIASFTGGDFQSFVNTQLEVEFSRWEIELARIEREYFPVNASVGILFL
jgi:hypothetical protein